MSKKIPGLYIIGDLANGKSYIGSSIDLQARLAQHKSLLSNNKHGNSALQEAHNSGNFLVAFPIPVADNVDHLEIEQCLLNEMIDDCNIYNVSKKATAYRLGSKATEETKEKQRAASTGRRHSPETRAKLSELAKKWGMPKAVSEASIAVRRGKSLSPEHKEKIGQASKANMTPEARQHLSDVNRGIPHSPADIEKIKQTKRARQGVPVSVNGIEYGSFAEAGEKLEMKGMDVRSRVVSNSREYKDWKYIEKK